MSALLDSLAAGFDGDASQRSRLAAVLRDGLPGARNEAWKYTSLRALERRAFASAPVRTAFDPSVLAGIPSPRLVFVNGRFDPAHSDSDRLPDGVSLRPRSALPATVDDADASSVATSDVVFAQLALLLATDGVILDVSEGTQAAVPIQLVFIGAPAAGDVASHLRHAITVGAGAGASVVEHYLHAGDHANFGNTLMQVDLAAGASLVHARMQAECPRATLVARTEAVLQADARYERVDLEMGAALSRQDVNVRLLGQRASVSANGVLLATGRAHVDTRLGVEHVGRDTRCDLLWRGLAAGRGRGVFRGGIVIQAGADGADARLSNKNLLLGEGAEIDTQPVLEIHADEVKAAHGATVGQLDPTALFYLRSRGLTAIDARRLLTAAFCREVTVAAPAVVRDALTAALERSLAALDLE